jgi:hypothetical protein
MTAEHGPGYLAVLPQAQASAKAGCGRGPTGIRRCGEASEVDGLLMACGAASYASAIQNPAALPDGLSRRGDNADDGRRGGIPPGRAGRAAWLPGDLSQADLVTEVDGALAAYHLWWARPGAPCVKQARYAAPHVPVRELGCIRPPVRDLVVSALLPGYGFALHRTPLEDLGIGMSSAASAAESRFNDILPAGRAGVNGQIAPRW